ncbi:hypothetical protein ACFO5R_03285 [Halosolutus amylolyticus]|uniref:Uncharacterized protein n=1 Tax=Halosolutus amylolyticus TaxID=2932267 RepID=A0ABD5PK45_9EURY|nr:hypothetical protein [Halosolutus amylolyticus]
MKRRTLLLGSTTLAVAGCVADDGEDPGTETDATGDDENADDADPDSVAGSVDGEITRPECEVEPETVEVEYGDEAREYETATTVPYPDSPSSFDRDAAVDYVETFDHAYVTHDVLCDRQSSGSVLDVGHSVRTTETFEWYDDVTVVFLLRAGGAVSGTDGEGNLWEADIGYGGVVYAIDESGAARVEFDDAPALDGDEYESQAPDPLESGELVATFE